MSMAHDDDLIPASDDLIPDEDHAWQPTVHTGGRHGGTPPAAGKRQSKRQGKGDDEDEDKQSHGRIMRSLLDTHYALIRSTEGRMFGVPRAEPTKAVPHDLKSSPLIRSVCRLFLDSEGKWPSTTGVAECSAYALMLFDDAPVQYVPLRCYWDREALAFYLDTCDDEDTVIRVDARGVTPCPAPYPFRRAAVPSAMPWTTTRGSAADLEPLWDLVPVVKEDQPIVLALMLTTWMTRTPQPVVLFTGTEDSGKTSTARYLLSYVDPTTIERGRGLPTDERQWKAAVSASRPVLIDNLSGLNADSSDLLCRVATGGEASTRAMYTDDSAHSSNLHVPVWLTAIDPGALRSDLASRMVTAELAALTEDTRLAESELAAKQEEIRAGVTRGLLWLASQVMREWPTIDKTKLPTRMGDFGIAVRCIDKILGADGESRLRADVQDLAAKVVESNILAQAVVAAVTPNADGTVLCPPRRMTPTELLQVLYGVRGYVMDGDRPSDSKAFPKTPGVLSAQLKRIAPALRKGHGILYEFGSSNGARWVKITRPGA